MMSKIITGSVMDVARRPLEAALKSYDPLLYLHWNPKKLKGHGTWELRRRDPQKSVVQILECDDGTTFVRIEHTENNVRNHVKDFEILDYRILDWVKAHDTWQMGMQTQNVVAQAERNMDAYEAEQAQKNKEDLRYMLSQDKAMWKDLIDYAQKPGQSIHDIAKHWK